MALTASALLTCCVGNRGGIGRGLDQSGLEAAADERSDGLAGLDIFHEGRVELFPVPLGAGEVAFWGQRRLAGMIAGGEKAAFLGSFDDDFRAVDMTGDDVDALIGKAVGRFRFLDGH